MSFDMKCVLDYSIGCRYKSKTQQMRVMTENWVEMNSYCPICGNEHIDHYKANRPVADFYCSQCHSDFELKSQEVKKVFSLRTIPDGAYNTMISRIMSNNNPHFFFLIHQNYVIKHLFMIPKFYFSPSCIIKRPPLSAHARRSGWIGCNIDLTSVPETGLVFLIKNEQCIPKNLVLDHYLKSKALAVNSIEKRGWILDVLKCVEKIPGNEFSLSDVYAFAEKLKSIHVTNHNIEAKIRQQLQVLRNRGFIEFMDRGKYRKLFSWF